jgi:hypothetical protein
VNASDAVSIFDEARLFLHDLRAQKYAEGMCLLVTCLPTAFDHYPELVHLALKSWPSIDSCVGKSRRLHLISIL